ncbi:hypothetical protein QTP81_10840 [Alteromonas sp. ASW11-36]|uniref:1-acyl-sn-glycerol-3-phosphate acyltransferase n=1 Tax=Alteromonas arenosi TaxID=3055817 RepID=A0ABT7SY32_9ALTE|nr:hypothetical protein [Alteromonas sp. ASW11-36]MDM7861093.1 hypothetical protein [Alteromonas sp. ASW11-36]
MIGNVLRFTLLYFVKLMRYWCYPTKVEWINPPTDKDWCDVRLILILNHTSLLEFIYSTAMPTRFLWQMSQRLVFPVADVSLRKPQGKILKLFAPRIASLSRKRDHTWKHFLELLASDSILIFMPEGRMKRPNGLDKNGQPMTVKSGICDLLPQFSGGSMIIAHSGGLHHVMAPGQSFPRPFRKLAVNLDAVNIDDYLAQFSTITDERERQSAICRDLETRRDRYCPTL